MHPSAPVTRAAAVVTGAVLAVLTIVGCSAQDRGPAPTKSPTAKATELRFSTPPADLEQITVDCAAGSAVIDQSNVEVTAGDCDEVRVTASNSVVHLGAVRSLVVTGSINDIHAGPVSSTMVQGSGNRITTDGSTKHSGKGTDNLFETR